MPLGLPIHGEVWRMRLPGKGLGSQWRYSLRGKERTRVAANFCVSLKNLGSLVVASVQVGTTSSHSHVFVFDDGFHHLPYLRMAHVIAAILLT